MRSSFLAATRRRRHADHCFERDGHVDALPTPPAHPTSAHEPTPRAAARRSRACAHAPTSIHSGHGALDQTEYIQVLHRERAMGKGKGKGKRTRGSVAGAGMAHGKLATCMDPRRRDRGPVGNTLKAKSTRLQAAHRNSVPSVARFGLEEATSHRCLPSRDVCCCAHRWQLVPPPRLRLVA